MSATKKEFIIIIVLCFAFGKAVAQPPEQENKIKFGVKGGVNASTVSVSLKESDANSDLTGYNADYNIRAGFNAGIFVEFPINKMFSIQPELKFSSKGMNSTTQIQKTYLPSSGFGLVELEAKTTVTSYYVELPLYLKAGFTYGKFGKIIAGVGPYFAYGVSGKLKNRYTLYSYSAQFGDKPEKHFLETWYGKKDIFKKDEVDITNVWYNMGGWTTQIGSWSREPYRRKPLDRFDAGLSGFIGYELNNGLFATLDCDWGLLNIMTATAAAWDGEVNGTMYNRTFSISLGYKF